MKKEKKIELLACYDETQFIFKCSAGQIHFNYGPVEIRFSPSSFKKFVRLVNQAHSNFIKRPETYYLMFSWDWLSLKISQKDISNFVNMVNQALFNLFGSTDEWSSRLN